MSTLIYTHPTCALHEMGYGHPERPDRLKAVLAALDAPDLKGLPRREAPEATIEQIARVHPVPYIEEILRAVPSRGYQALGMDTVMNPHTAAAALRAAGAVCAAVDDVMAGRAPTAFCAVRPPGHHAEPETAMGFCFFNNVAIGAAQARAVHGVKRVAVIDFDVHHGNGTQAMFEADPNLFFASTHQWPLYPGTGRPSERGVGNIVNCPLPPAAGSEEFREAFRERILPALVEFSPDLIMVSAGFDAHRSDPLANLELEDEDYAWATRELLRVADHACAGRIVSTLEGGYDLAALAASAAAHVRSLARLQ
ncbi:MAG: histone deacetylase family protein [Alphaproteobacteria bacterium]|nr:histone deacetylase family protein [Alphaproteobacteria bacterium]